MKANGQAGKGRIPSVHAAVFQLTDFEVNVYGELVGPCVRAVVGHVKMKQCALC